MHNLCFVVIFCFSYATSTYATSFFINQTLDQLAYITLATTTTKTSTTSRPSINNLKYKCATYLISKNIKSGDLVMIFQNDQQQQQQSNSLFNLMIDHNFISSTMKSTNVMLVNYNEWSKSEPFFSPNKFQHQLGIVSVYVIESSIRTLKKQLSMAFDITNTNHQRLRMEFNSRAMVILFLAYENTLNDDVNENLLRAFNIFWHYYIFNTLIMVCTNGIDGNKSSTVSMSYGGCSVYTWYPYDSLSNCGQNLSNYEKIFECNYNSIDNNSTTYTDDCIRINYTNSYDKLSIEKMYSNINDNNVDDEDEWWWRKRCWQYIEANRNDMQSVVGMNDDGNFNNGTWTRVPIPSRPISSASRRRKSHLHDEDVFGFFEDDNNSATQQQNASGQQQQQQQHHDTIIVQRQDERNWDKKYVGEFFAYNYRPYGTIEYRQEKNENDKDNDNRKAKPVSAQLRRTNKRIPIGGTTHFFDKIPANMDGCRFRCLLFVWPPFVTPPHIKWIGLEHKLLLDISRYMNFHLDEDYVSVSLNVHDGTENNFQLLNVLSNSSADLAFGNIYPNIDVHKSFDNSIGYLYDHVNWVVPLARDQPMWLNLVRCFR